MNVKGLAWLGTKTDRFEEMARFYEEVMNLRPKTREPGVAVYRLPNGDTVELFGSSGYDYFDSGPVAGFEVDDVEATRAEMEAKGIEFLAPTAIGGGYTWAHFRAPDGNVYEITGLM
jgi:catechol 2,3-dioxygenase-like lactoylglutathione lyase family enzyme